MEVYYCPQVFVCYPELRRRDRAGLGVIVRRVEMRQLVPKQNRVDDLDFHRLWKLCGKRVFAQAYLTKWRRQDGGCDDG